MIRSLAPRFLRLTLLLLLSGCVAATPETLFYTLNPVAAPEHIAPDLAVGVVLAEFPAALDQPQIVVRSGENRLKLAEMHRWAGPLSQQFIQTLVENLLHQTGSQRIASAPWEGGFHPDRRVAISLLRLDGARGGEVVLTARWTISNAEREILAVRYSTLQESAEHTFESLVAAESRLVARLAGEIALALKR